jgi:hypothetical protein
MPTTQQIKCIRGLLAITGNASNKETIVAGFSAVDSVHITELTPNETNALIKHLQQLKPVDVSVQKMKGKILYFAHEMNMTKANRHGKIVADMQAVDAWMLKYSYKKKKLDAYKPGELPKLVSQFQQVYEHYLNN